MAMRITTETEVGDAEEGEEGEEGEEDEEDAAPLTYLARHPVPPGMSRPRLRPETSGPADRR